VGKAMALEPAARYASASDLRAALLAGGATAPDADLTSTSLAAAPGTTRAAPVPQVGGPATDPGAPLPSFRQQERAMLIPTVIVVLVAIALGVAGLLLGGSGAGNLFDGVRDALGGGNGELLPITAATSFDPEGNDREENSGLAPLVFDGRADTDWHTEGYNDRDITKLKSGVGLVVQVDGVHDLEQLEIDSPTNDWRAVIYVADTPQSTLAGWGEPVATPDALARGTNEIDLGGHDGGAVLIWITDRGDAPGRAGAVIDEVRVRGS
jgi:hypothetical protein